MDKVRFGVIGTGGMGSGHCNMIPEIPETELTAICDIDPTTRAAISAKHCVPGFATHKELIESGLVDAVIIATPHYFHPPIAQDAFRAGLHVISEKPLGVTVSGADSMIREAAASGKKFGVMYQMRTEPSKRAAKQIIESGRLGNIYRTSLVMGWYRSQAYYNSGGWRATWKGEGGGVLINQAPHFLDMFTWLGGLPAAITATTRTRLHDIEVEDEAFATLEYANGAHGYLYATTNETPQQEQFEFCGDRGKLVLSGSTIRFYEMDTPIREFTETNTQPWAYPASKEAPVDLPPEMDMTSHSAITQNFARAVLTGSPLLAPGEEGLNAVEMIDGMLLSGHRGKTVHLPVDRAEYDAFIEEMKLSSREKTNVQEQRLIDPKFA